MASCRSKLDFFSLPGVLAALLEAEAVLSVAPPS
jgi:hypothetical protein